MLCVCVCLNAEIKYSKQQPNVWHIQYQHEFMTLNTIRSESFRCMNCHNNKLICEIANARKLNAKYCDVWLSLYYSLVYVFLCHLILFYLVARIFVCTGFPCAYVSLSMYKHSIYPWFWFHFAHHCYCILYEHSFQCFYLLSLRLSLSLSPSLFLRSFVCLAFIWFTWKTWCTFSCLFLTSYRIYEYAKKKWQR